MVHMCMIHYRVCKIDLSLARQDVRQTSSLSQHMLNYRQTFHCKISSEYQLFAGYQYQIYSPDTVVDLPSPKKMSGAIKPLRWTFCKICRRISRTLETLSVCLTYPGCEAYIASYCAEDAGIMTGTGCWTTTTAVPGGALNCTPPPCSTA